MPRKRKLLVGVLNIKIHPHSPERYVELFRDIFEAANSVQIRGNDWGTPGWISENITNQPLEGLNGQFYKFLNIDPRDPWFDQSRREVIEIEGEDAEPPVPSHLKPNLHKIRFAFFPKKHRFFYDTDRFTPLVARKFLRGLFDSPDIVSKYGYVDVEIVSSKEVIERLLAIPSKTKLEIRVSLPNPDDTSEEEQRVLDRLRNQNAKRVDEIYTGTKEDGLIPDADTIMLMRVATSNGYVKATGYEQGKKIDFSTLQHPLLEPEYYNPDTTSRRDALLSKSERLLDGRR